MSEQATFKIIRSTPFIIRVGGDIDREFHFTVPRGTLLNTSSMLDFSVECTLDRGYDDVGLLRTTLNGKVIYDGFGDGASEFVRHIYKRGLLKEGNLSNKLQFRMETILGRGRLRFIEVVLWVKVQDEGAAA